ncbi:MAG: hypothetical protein N2C14_11265 [Planctomycetales bacterium]
MAREVLTPPRGLVFPGRAITLQQVLSRGRNAGERVKSVLLYWRLVYHLGAMYERQRFASWLEDQAAGAELSQGLKPELDAALA